MSDPLEAPLRALADQHGWSGTRTADVDAGQLELADPPDSPDDDDEFELVDEEFDPAAVRERRPRKRRRHGGQSEAGLTRDVISDLNARPHVVAQKITPAAAGGKGEPDVDGVIRAASGLGRSFKIELKVGSARPTAVQTRRLLQWQDVGALVGWATSLDEVDQILAHVDDPAYRWAPDMGSGAPPVAA